MMQDRIDDDEAERERREPVGERARCSAATCALAGGGRSARRSRHGAITSEPNSRTAGDDGDDGKQQRPARFELSSLRMFCTVLKPISGRNRPKATSAVSAGVLQRARDVDARGGRATA